MFWGVYMPELHLRRRSIDQSPGETQENNKYCRLLFKCSLPVWEVNRSWVSRHLPSVYTDSICAAKSRHSGPITSNLCVFTARATKWLWSVPEGPLCSAPFRMHVRSTSSAVAPSLSQSMWFRSFQAGSLKDPASGEFQNTTHGTVFRL